MIILHALYSSSHPKSILLFGESTSLSGITEKQNSDSDQIQFPFAVHPDILREVLLQLTSETIKYHDDIILRHPVQEKYATGSLAYRSALNVPQANPDSDQAFITPVLSTSIFFFFSLFSEKKNESLDLKCGGTVSFWILVTKLAEEMIRRGRYLPASGRYQNGGTCTRWKIQPSTFDQSRIEDLALSLPPIAFQYQKQTSGTFTSQSVQDLIVLFLETMIMEITARSYQEKPFQPEINLSPIDQMRYAEVLTAIYFLQGFDRHKMPIKQPLITNGWRDRFDRWTTLPKEKVSDDLPWHVMGRIRILKNDPENLVRPNENGIWYIEFTVVSSDDQNNPIPTEQWRNVESLPALLLPTLEELEGELTNYSEIICRISPNLAIRRISSINILFLIPDDDLIRFLTYDLLEIEKLGLHIIKPDWWEEKAQPFRFGLALSHESESEHPSFVGVQSLLRFDYRLSIGDEIVDPDEFKRMVNQKLPFVRAGKRFIRIDSDRVENIITGFDKKFKIKKFSVGEFLRFTAGWKQTDTELAFYPEDTESLNLVSFLHEGHFPTLECPVSFSGNLRPYQKVGLAFLMTCRSMGFGACLADDMGLGKTPQTIAYLLSLKEQNLIHIPALIICPTSIIGNWERELSRFSPSLSVYIHHGSSRKKGEQFISHCQRYDLIITSYSLLYRDHQILSRLRWSTLIYDEIQNIKNSQTKQFNAAKTLNSEHQIALTGTPVENHLHELWAIMELLNPGYLGTLTSFQKHYAGPIEKNKDVERVSELRRLIRPFLLRRTKLDKSVIDDLPEKMEVKIFCPLTHEQAAMYQATLNNLSIELKTVQGIARKGRILSTLTRLKQICNHPSLVSKNHSHEPIQSGKVQRLIEMLEEVKEENDAAIIFTQYATFAEILVQMIKSALQREVLILTGSTPRLKREDMINRFMHQDGPQFFVISLRAGGTGLNLMRANHVFHIDRWWNPAIEDQATDRTFRIGQKRNVLVHLMIASGTLEEQIDEMISRKRSIADQVITSGEEWLTELPTSELMEILKLRESVFGDDIE